MEKDKLETIIKNQCILNSKLDIIIQMMIANQNVVNCQMFISGIALADLTNLEEKTKR